MLECFVVEREYPLYSSRVYFFKEREREKKIRTKGNICMSKQVFSNVFSPSLTNTAQSLLIDCDIRRQISKVSVRVDYFLLGARSNWNKEWQEFHGG